LQSFETSTQAEGVQIVDIINRGIEALEEINTAKGLGFDSWDLDFYSKMFLEKLGRNPTDVECFDLAQSNSEHSRHWFFGGRMVIDGIEKDTTLFSMVKSTLSGDNSIIAFHDNSSSIRGTQVSALLPTNPGTASSFQPKTVIYHPILTAETHNFPTGVAPFAGAETGTGGRLRDVMATGNPLYLFFYFLPQPGFNFSQDVAPILSQVFLRTV
jgi:phosphoribosylformylglycinamidine synthase